MSDTEFDICVIGSGPAGLAVASGAAREGQSVCLIEESGLGGDCLFNGCIPSKSLISLADEAVPSHWARALGAEMGTENGDLKQRFSDAMSAVGRVVASVARDGGASALADQNVTLVKGRARFISPAEVAVTGAMEAPRVRARHFVIATGSRPHIPEGIGLEDTFHFTTETIWALRDAPESMIVLGAGTIGSEFAQAFARLGVEVMLADRVRLIQEEDPDQVDIIRTQLESDGVILLEDLDVMGVASYRGGIQLRTRSDMVEGNFNASAVLVTAGRRPNVSNLGLEAAGVRYSDFGGIQTDEQCRTNVPSISAIGDARGGLRSSHGAWHHATIVLDRLVFKRRASVQSRILPRVTYTDPGLAAVGMTAAKAKARYGDAVTLIDAGFEANAAAITASDSDGFGRLIMLDGETVLGASIVGPMAAELIAPWQWVLAGKLTLEDIARTPFAFPTRSSINRQMAETALMEARKTRSPSGFMRLLQRL